MVAAVVLVGLWWLVAHNAGSGWVQVLGDLVFGTLLVGTVGPFVVVARARIGVRSAPADGNAGRPVELRVDVGPRVRVRPVQPPGPEVFVGSRGRGRAVDDVVVLLPERRGVHDSVTLDIASAAPFGLQWWTRCVQLPLPAALHVAPRCGRAPAPPPRPAEGAGDAHEQPRRDGSLPRGARPYLPGDGRRLVHWRSTAHAGTLMVRELEQPAAEAVSISVELPADPDAAERVAEGALGTVAGALEAGAPVLLATREESGPVLAAVADRRGAGRRLARAVPGPLDVGSGGDQGLPP